MRDNLIIFVKYPEPGKVKTRIGKIIGNEKAADMYSSFVHHIMNSLINSDSFQISVFFTPKNREKLLKSWLNSSKIDYFPQNGRTLGEKISNSFERSFSDGFKNTIIIGSDCVELSREAITLSFNYLNDHSDCVIGPASDGGYYLIGLRSKNFPYIFEDISWSSDSVFDETVKKINYLNLKCIILRKLNDVDDIGDLNDNVVKLVTKYHPDFKAQ